MQRGAADVVPVPVGFALNQVQSDTSCDEVKRSWFVAHGPLSLSTVKEWYCAQLELWGWQFDDFSTEHEVLLVGCRPRRHCAVSVRQHGAMSEVYGVLSGEGSWES